MLYISSVPRGGGGYTAAVLKESGYDVGYEEGGPEGEVGWQLLLDLDATPDYHQVREPLVSIASLTQLGSRIFNRMEPLIGPFGETKLERAIRTYLKWNTMGLAKADSWFRVEDLGPDTIEGYPLSRKALEVVPKNVNSRPHPAYQWSDLGKYEEDVRRLGKELGYGEG